MPDKISPGQARAEASASHVTSAVGLAETAGRLRARRSSLFTQTIVWVTGLVCLAFLLGSVAQAWSNSRMMQDLQNAQQQTQQLQKEHDRLAQQAAYYQDPYVIEGEARQQQGFARSNEHVVVVTGTNGQQQQQQPTQAASAVSQNFWQDWWNLFFGNG